MSLLSAARTNFGVIVATKKLFYVRLIHNCSLKTFFNQTFPLFFKNKMDFIEEVAGIIGGTIFLDTAAEVQYV